MQCVFVHIQRPLAWLKLTISHWPFYDQFQDFANKQVQFARTHLLTIVMFLL